MTFSVENIGDNVDRIQLGEKTIYLVGTAHISQASVELAERTIREQQPDSVAIELCESRYKALQDPDRWKNMDLFAVIRQGKAYVLLAQLLLASFQKKLGEKLNIKPGAEMMRAAEVAKEMGCTIVLADRDVRTTLKRTWASLGIWEMGKVIGALLTGMFSNQSLDSAEIERMKSKDALEELMGDFTKELPGVREALIDERDRYLAAKVAAAPGKRIVAVIGAGHIPGMKKYFQENIDIAQLEEIPPPSPWSRLFGWAIPVSVLALMVYGFWVAGADKGLELIGLWFWINALLAGTGALVALAHPLTILAAGFAAPFTAINPFLASGWVAALVEASVRKPRVADLESVTEEIGSLRGIWTNRVSRIFLVIITTNLFGSIGTIIGIKEIAQHLN
jgi:pheromone shutdown-related protein TraB